MHELAHEFTSRRISPWGGVKFFHKTYVTSGIRDFLLTLPLPAPGSNRGYNPIDIAEGLLASIVLGARRLEHSGMIRTDSVIQEIFGWEKGMASSSTFSRFLNKFDKERNANIFPPLMKYMLSTLPLNRLTIDLDSSVITRYGHQEGVKVGYNPVKKGRASHHPLLAFCDELKMVLNAWMRPGNSDSKTDALLFLDELIQIVTCQKIGLIRGDVGFYSNNIMSYLETKKVDYLFKARDSGSIMGKIQDISQWYFSDDVIKGACYAEIEFKSAKWTKPRRVIIVGTPKKDSKRKSRVQEMFKEYEIFNEFEFSSYITNTKMSEVEIHRKYNQRGEAENRIKELKYDFGMDGFALKSFQATEAAFRFVMIAFNIMTIFKQAIMRSKINHRLPTIKFQCIAIGSYLVSSGRKITMKLSAEGKRRHFLEHLFEKLEVIRPPYKFSNA